ncbi:MAG TPA: hypothetical protein ENI68_12355 [Gammaproteobacteria bacterium]|nr:hypothetical protein [Gammaproteobacteria bacterium]
MKNIACCQVVRLAFCLAMLLRVGVSVAAVDKFDPYAFARVLYDSNIFRASGNVTDEEDDTVTHLGGGMESDLKLSRQHLLLDLEVDRVLYDNFGNLDHTRVNGVGTWDWQVGNLWSGNLGYQYKRVMSSFNEQFTREKDMRTTQTGFLDAGYQIHPDWRLKIGVDYSEISYQKRGRLDRDSTAGSLEVQYKNTLNTRVGVRVKYTGNDLSQQQDVLGAKVNNDYTETEVSGVFYWEGSGKSSLEASLGYTDQKFDELGDRDFQGSTGRLTYKWKVTGKTKLDFSVWRETSTKSNEITTYILSKGVKIKPTWQATSKISVFGDASLYNENFKGQNEIDAALGGQRRDDDRWQYRIGTRWDPRKYVQLSLSYLKQKRDSSIDARDFKDNQIEARARFDF